MCFLLKTTSGLSLKKNTSLKSDATSMLVTGVDIMVKTDKPGMGSECVVDSSLPVSTSWGNCWCRHATGKGFNVYIPAVPSLLQAIRFYEYNPHFWRQVPCKCVMEDFKRACYRTTAELTPVSTRGCHAIRRKERIGYQAHEAGVSFLRWSCQRNSRSIAPQDINQSSPNFALTGPLTSLRASLSIGKRQSSRMQPYDGDTLLMPSSYRKQQLFYFDHAVSQQASIPCASPGPPSPGPPPPSTCRRASKGCPEAAPTTPTTATGLAMAVRRCAAQRPGRASCFRLI